MEIEDFMEKFPKNQLFINFVITRPIAISRVLREQRRTDGPTDGPTDRPTKRLIESRARD